MVVRALSAGETTDLVCNVIRGRIVRHFYNSVTGELVTATMMKRISRKHLKSRLAQTPLETLLGRSFRNKASKHMAFPHPQSRKDHHRNEDKPRCGSIVRKSLKRTINVTEYWNAEDQVNPAKNRTLGRSIHGRLREHSRCIVLPSPRFRIFDPP